MDCRLTVDSIYVKLKESHAISVDSRSVIFGDTHTLTMAILVDPISIETMLPSDLEAVYRIDQLSFPTPWLESAYLVELSNRSASYFVARLNQQVVAYAGQWVIMDEVHITTLAVDPEYRGRKIGERLLLALLEEAILQGARRATLEVREGNRAAQNLYRKYGFHEAAIRKSYYSDNGENAVVMWAEQIHLPSYQQHLRDMRYQLHLDYQNRLR